VPPWRSLAIPPKNRTSASAFTVAPPHLPHNRNHRRSLIVPRRQKPRIRLSHPGLFFVRRSYPGRPNFAFTGFPGVCTHKDPQKTPQRPIATCTKTPQRPIATCTKTPQRPIATCTKTPQPRVARDASGMEHEKKSHRLQYFRNIQKNNQHHKKRKKLVIPPLYLYKKNRS